VQISTPRVITTVLACNLRAELKKLKHERYTSHETSISIRKTQNVLVIKNLSPSSSRRTFMYRHFTRLFSPAAATTCIYLS
jgi:hypothetical protein